MIQKGTDNSRSNNSFLLETGRISDIGDDIRQAIELKFKQSRSNALYVFPRTRTFKFPLKKKPIRIRRTLLRSTHNKENSLKKPVLHSRNTSSSTTLLPKPRVVKHFRCTSGFVTFQAKSYKPCLKH